MKIAFIGLGNVGGKLAGSLLRNGFDLTVRDLSRDAARAHLDRGAGWGESPASMAHAADLIITCLPSPAASAAVMEADDGILAGIRPGAIWAEMSTSDEAEVKRLGALVISKGAEPLDCSVSGGCHRAASGCSLRASPPRSWTTKRRNRATRWWSSGDGPRKARRPKGSPAPPAASRVRGRSRGDAAPDARSDVDEQAA